MSTLQTAVQQLTDPQRKAVDWQEGAMLVLAGPRSGKTQVLACRVGRILMGSAEKRFRVLALTFTNKAALEIRDQVSTFVPKLCKRATIGTYHAFCEQVLRQHGAHIGIDPYFEVFSLDADRVAVFRDALRRADAMGQNVSIDDERYFGRVDRRKARGETVGVVDFEDGENGRIQGLCQLYDEELRRANALDFNTMITETCRLFTTYPEIARFYQRSYRYWLVDEFQDMSRAQYKLIRSMATHGFRNIFAVADDDQSIYDWNGANLQHIRDFESDFESSRLQFPTSFRCPPRIIETASRLVIHNADRVSGKERSRTVRLDCPSDFIELLPFATELNESEGIADRIMKAGQSTWGDTVVLARRHRMVESVAEALSHRGVTCQIVKQGTEFASPEMRWMAACLRLTNRPLDERCFITLVENYNVFAQTTLDAEMLASQAKADATSYLDVWLRAAETHGNRDELVEKVRRAMEYPDNLKKWNDIVVLFEKYNLQLNEPSDVGEDLLIWKTALQRYHDHNSEQSIMPPFLQNFRPNTIDVVTNNESVSLAAIHDVKDRQFTHVYLMGMAEEELPSNNSIRKGPNSRELEEERRNCFVAITRTQNKLTLSWADSYNGLARSPSRFLFEMGLVR